MLPRKAALAALLLEAASRLAASERLGDSDDAGSGGLPTAATGGATAGAVAGGGVQAAVPYWNAELMTKLAAHIRRTAFRNDVLNVPDRLLRSLDSEIKKCSQWADYTSANETQWQCPESDLKFQPSQSVKDLIQGFVEDGSIDPRPMLRMGSGGARWCTNTIQHEMETKNAKEYFKNCGAQAGYFNVLRCRDETVYVVLGVSAANGNSCLPAHTHRAEEVMWQVGGSAEWRKWETDADGNLEKTSAGVGAKGEAHHHGHGVVHEHESSSGFLAVHFWAQPTDWTLYPGAIGHDHHFVEVGDGSCWEKSCASCLGSTYGFEPTGKPSCWGAKKVDSYPKITIPGFGEVENKI